MGCLSELSISAGAALGVLPISEVPQPQPWADAMLRLLPRAALLSPPIQFGLVATTRLFSSVSMRPTHSLMREKNYEPDAI